MTRSKLFRHVSLKRRRQGGIALFFVMGSIALLTVLMAELTYSTQIHSRLSYNYVDGLKAYYLAKTAFKLSLVRLRAYLQVKTFLDEPNNKQMKDALPKGVLDKIWNLPLLYPLPIPKEASIVEGDAIKEFMKESALQGTYTANISGESAKLNLNLLFVKEVKPEAQGSSGASGATGATGASGASGRPAAAPQTAQGPSGASSTPVDFRPVLEGAITSLLEQKKNEDREFADAYRNVQGRDVVDAIEYYMFPEKPVSNLPGFKVFKPKLAPLYSITELHLIPGIDDEIYALLDGSFTVYSTPGINMNTMTKRTLMAIVPTLTDQDATDVLRKRDDPEFGNPWGTEDEFLKDLSGVGSAGSIDELKNRLRKSNLKFIAEENSFKISVLANVGQSTRRLEAYVILDPKAAKQPPGPQQPQQGNIGQAPSQAPGQGGPGNQQDPSAKKPTGVNLIYWRML